MNETNHNTLPSPEMSLEDAVRIFNDRSNGGGTVDKDGTLHVSTSKGGRVWIDGEFTLDELEAALVISRHKYNLQLESLPVVLPKAGAGHFRVFARCRTAQDLYALLSQIPEHARRDLPLAVDILSAEQANPTGEIHVEALRDDDDDFLVIEAGPDNQVRRCD